MQHPAQAINWFLLFHVQEAGFLRAREGKSLKLNGYS
jgi:hypothetical protein